MRAKPAIAGVAGRELVSPIPRVQGLVRSSRGGGGRPLVVAPTCDERERGIRVTYIWFRISAGYGLCSPVPEKPISRPGRGGGMPSQGKEVHEDARGFRSETWRRET